MSSDNRNVNRDGQHARRRNPLGLEGDPRVGQATEGASLQAYRTQIKACCESNEYHIVAVHTDMLTSRKRLDDQPGLHKAPAVVCSGSRQACPCQLSAV